MSIVIQKGGGFSGKYTQPVIATASDWDGTAKLYSSYPDGVEKISTQLELSVDGTELQFDLDAASILDLDAGVYTLVGSISSVSAGISAQNVSYLTVVEVQASAQPMTTLTMTIGKRDGTAAGTPTKALTNTTSGTALVNGWKGVEVTASYPAAEAIDGVIFGIERTRTETNAAGYAQLVVIKGSTVTVSCPSFGKSVTVDTTGKDSIDLSEFF